MAERVNSVPDSDLTSTPSTASSLFGSGDLSASSSSSGDFTDGTPATEAARGRCVGKFSNGVSYGWSSVIGRRKEMEDAVRVELGFVKGSCDRVGGCTDKGSRCSNAVAPVHFFGVYDGHGGSQVAKFCEGRMHEVVAEEWDQETIAEFEWRHKWEAALSKGFERADNDIPAGATSEGSTAVVSVLSGCQIITSNCGDSRAILCRGTKTLPLSVDQKPDREDELARIENLGGKVINWGGARVLGVLSMSRAIGDHYLRPYIIPVPEINFTTRSDDDECLILASDGLWDVMTNDEVGEIARRILRKRRRLMSDDTPTAAQTVADSLTEIAMARHTSDNISIIVVDLKPKTKKTVQVKQ